MPKYAVLDKDTIKKEIMPYLSIAKRGFISKFDLLSIVTAILSKFKTGCQWEHLPVHHFFDWETPSYKTVFHHYKKWCKLGDREKMFSRLVRKKCIKRQFNAWELFGSKQTYIYLSKR